MASDTNRPGEGDSDLSDRVTRIEERLDAMEQAISALSAPPAPPAPSAPRIVLPPPAPDAVPITMPAPPEDLFEHQPPPPPTFASDNRRTATARPPTPLITAEMALRWAGVVLVFFAAVFLVSTAVSRGWVGPEVQLGLATLGGAALIGTGIHLDRRWGGDRRPWSLALMNVGLVVLGVCAGAAHAWLDLVPVGVASALIVVVLSLALALADRYRHDSLAISGLAVALVAPGVIGAYEEFGDLATGGWLLFLVAVTMALAIRYDWVIPRLLGLVSIGPFMVVLTQEFVDVTGGVALAIQAMIVIAGLAWWLAPWIRPAVESLRALDHRLVFVVPALVWLSSSGLWTTTDDGRALMAIIVAAGFGAVTASIHVGGSGVAARPPGPLARQLLLGHLVGVSSLVTIALALWFDGPALLAVLAVQALGTTALISRTEDLLLDINAALLGATVALWTATALVEGIEDGLEPADGVVHLGVLLAAWVAAWLLRKRAVGLAGLMAVAAWVGLLAWVMAVLRPIPQGQMLVSITWTALGVALVVVGLGLVRFDRRWWPSRRDPGLNQVKAVGLATLAATVVKLITVDLAEVDTIWRALLFAVVGVGLLRLGYRIGLLDRSGEADDLADGTVDEDRRPL